VYREERFPLCKISCKENSHPPQEEEKLLDNTMSDPEEPNLKSHRHEDSNLMLCLQVREADIFINNLGTPISFCVKMINEF
jgi:hypothetical protein